MNKLRRKEIESVALELENLKDKLNDILSDEQDYYDNIPENLQCSSNAETSEEAIDMLEEKIDELDTVIDGLKDICY